MHVQTSPTNHKTNVYPLRPGPATQLADDEDIEQEDGERHQQEGQDLDTQVPQDQQARVAAAYDLPTHGTDSPIRYTDKLWDHRQKLSKRTITGITGGHGLNRRITDRH